jgi:hypothetical protein
MIFNLTYIDSQGKETPVTVDTESGMHALELSDLGFIMLRTYDKSTGSWIKFKIGRIQEVEKENKSIRYDG